MFEVVYEHQKPWPKEGPLKVEAQFSGEIQVPPTVAQRRVAGFLGQYVTLMVVPGAPVLVIGEPLVWRVPAYLHLPGLGEVGTVGTVDVDALTGEIYTPSPEHITAMQRRADEIAIRLTSPTTPRS